MVVEDEQSVHGQGFTPPHRRARPGPPRVQHGWRPRRRLLEVVNLLLQPPTTMTTYTAAVVAGAALTPDDFQSPLLGTAKVHISLLSKHFILF